MLLAACVSRPPELLSYVVTNRVIFLPSAMSLVSVPVGMSDRKSVV